MVHLVTMSSRVLFSNEIGFKTTSLDFKTPLEPEDGFSVSVAFFASRVVLPVLAPVEAVDIDVVVVAVDASTFLSAAGLEPKENPVVEVVLPLPPVVALPNAGLDVSSFFVVAPNENEGFDAIASVFDWPVAAEPKEKVGFNADVVPVVEDCPVDFVSVPSFLVEEPNVNAGLVAVLLSAFFGCSSGLAVLVPSAVPEPKLNAGFAAEVGAVVEPPLESLLAEPKEKTGFEVAVDVVPAVAVSFPKPSLPVLDAPNVNMGLEEAVEAVEDVAPAVSVFLSVEEPKLKLGFVAVVLDVSVGAFEVAPKEKVGLEKVVTVLSFPLAPAVVAEPKVEPKLKAGLVVDVPLPVALFALLF